jgi:hypothetical protein
MRPGKLLTGLASASLLSGLFVMTAVAAVPAAAATTTQRLEQATLVGSTVFKPSAANLTVGLTSAGVPAAYTDDSFRTNDNHANANINAVSGPAAAALTPKVSAAADPSTGDVQSVKGLNAFSQGTTHGFDVEPPDQGLCAGNGYVIEMVNLVLQVYNANLHPVSGPEALETFFGQPLAFGFAGGDITVQGDPRCYWDQATHRWFLSQLDLDETAGTSQFMLAVSQTSSPVGGFNLYSLDNTDNFNPGCSGGAGPGCFGDQPLLGANGDAIFISTNEFPIFNNGFNGSVLYTIDKHALAIGASSANTVVSYIGLTMPVPGTSAGSCTTSGGVYCWYSVVPSTSPAVQNYNPSGGVEYALSALDFVNAGDNRIALWAITNTSSIRKAAPAIGITESTVKSETYAFPPNASQKAGPIPLGDSGALTGGTPEPEGPIATNDDRMNATVYENGVIWGALNTRMTVVSQGKIGIAYFAVTPHLTNHGLNGSIAEQGYVVANGNNVYFPSIGLDTEGQGIMSFTLSGPGYYPSSAYTTISLGSGAGPVHIAALGQSPQDGFTEYQGFGTPAWRPRWGDYSSSVAVGSEIYFAAEYIQYPNCSDSAFASDPTCGGTRDPFANWGTALNKAHV